MLLAGSAGGPPPQAAHGPAASANPPVRRELVQTYLRDVHGLSDRDWRRVLAGQAVARLMPGEDGQDVNVFGVVRVRRPADDVLRLVRRIDQFERAMGIDAVGRFSDPPRPGDLSALSLPDHDIEDLRACRPGNCDLQLSASAIAALERGVNWRQPDAGAAAQRIIRGTILDQVLAYRARGVPAIAPYADREPATAVDQELARVLRPTDVPIEAPGAFAWLQRYPGGPSDGVIDFFYWNLGDFGMKPTLRVNHMALFPVPEAGRARGVQAIVATRQVYASHYFSATIEWRTIVEDDETGACFVLYATRSRVTGLSGFIGTLIRSRVRGRARAGMERYLHRTRNLIETGSPHGSLEQGAPVIVGMRDAHFRVRSLDGAGLRHPREALLDRK
jgi:hypothetical protein